MREDGSILLIDDDEHIRTIVSLMLTDEGYTVLTATDGASALGVIEQTPLRLILLDIYMPAMDGEAFLREYRQRPVGQAPVILFSAGQIPQSALAMAAGVLTKPFDISDLIRTVQEHSRIAAEN